jgi:hypothetical protein
MKPNFIQSALQRLVGLHSLQGGVRETDDTLRVGAVAGGLRERFPYDREDVQQQALEAWRTNPLARRIIGLTTEYVVGSGLRVSCKHASTDRFIRAFWEHPLNRLDVKLYEWCDELSRTGNLFLLVSTDPAGMSYVRAVPSEQIGSITSAVHDVEQERWYTPKPSLDDPQPPPWPALQEGEEQTEAMLHYAVNRPVGAQWGESDLAPLLKWLARYAN